MGGCGCGHLHIRHALTARLLLDEVPVNPLGLLAVKRIGAFSDLPSFAELALPDVDVTSWSGIAVPVATPLAVRRQLGVILREITDDPVHGKAFAALGLETAYLPMAPFGAVIQSEVARWTKFVKETGLGCASTELP